MSGRTKAEGVAGAETYLGRGWWNGMEPRQKDPLPLFGRDIAWEYVREKFCRVVSFLPQAEIKDGKVSRLRAAPYGFLIVECEGLPSEAAILVTHRIDYLHLWEAFAQRNEEKGEEVLVAYVPARLRLLRGILPMLVVYLCPQGAFNKITHREPTKSGVAGWREIAPIAKWGGEN